MRPWHVFALLAVFFASRAVRDPADWWVHALRAFSFTLAALAARLAWKDNRR